MNLTQQEKNILMVLVISVIIMITVSLFIGRRVQNNNEKVYNSKIKVIHTGGEVEHNFEEKYGKNKNKIGRFDVTEYKPQIVSSNISASDWNKIAKDISLAYNNYDVFIIIGGRETMAYTASMLSFMLENLSKPVILSDENVLDALILASKTRIPEVMVSSRGKLLRGCRTIQGSTEYLTSPNYPTLHNHNSLQKSKEQIGVKFVNPEIKIVVIKVYPGDDGKQLLSILTNKMAHGIVLETFGGGKVPISNEFFEVVNKLSKQGVIIVAVSECNQAMYIDMDPRLLEAGILPGYDMTVPAAYAKLSFLLGNVKDKQLIGLLMDRVYRGEMTIDEEIVQDIQSSPPITTLHSNGNFDNQKQLNRNQ